MKTQGRILLPVLIVLLLAGPINLVSAPAAKTAGSVLPAFPVIPKPLSFKVEPGRFSLSSESRILVDDTEECMHLGEYLSQVIRQATRLILPISLRASEGTSSPTVLVLTTDKADRALGPEGYELTIGSREARVRASAGPGLFYGIQTLHQLLPPASETVPAADVPAPVSLPCVRVQDRPRFGWRGLLLDCGRHFMSRDFVKRYIDLLALYKMNRLHWHLTEDQGWRIEIKKYPNFTAKGAWRRTEDGVVYGGFYTQDDIREVVAYAQRRYVTVIPEIEMPGHSVAALAAYPELSCTGGPFEVQNYWGVHPDVYCAGNERTFEVLEDVLSEVADLFPAPYIHIGGDECPKDRWKACPKCQARIKAEGLKNEDGLQSYFIKRIEKFLQTKNRRLIGWDEILEGGLPPQATVQSWRGFEGAVAAARSGHDTIVSPTKYAYFDYDLETTDLRKVFDFEPVPKGLTTAQQHHILGGECNMWSESAPQETIDGKLFPRILAMAERLWSPEKDRNFAEFERRAWEQSDRLQRAGVEVGDECHALNLIPTFRPETKKVTVALRPAEEGLILRVTTDGTPPTLNSPRYDSPLTILNTCRVLARAFKGDRPYGDLVAQPFALHQALGKPVRRFTVYNPRRAAGGDMALTDGIRGNALLDEATWQGYLGQDVDLIVDMGEIKPIGMIAVGFLQDSSHDVFMPSVVDFAVSDDGTNFRPAGRAVNTVAKDNPDLMIKDFSARPMAVQGRFVRITAHNIGVCPPPHPDLGEKTWLFTDEIIIN